MRFLLPSLRQGWRTATKPFRLVRRLRQMHTILAEVLERTRRAEEGQRDFAAQVRGLVAELAASIGQIRAHQSQEFDRQQGQLTQQLNKLSSQLEQAHQHQLNKLQSVGKLAGKLPPLEQLRLLYPWPAVRPPVAPCNRGFDYGGREIVTRRLAEGRVKVVLEIGSFLGLSTRTWLSAAAGATIICVDPWYDFYEDDSGLRHWPDVVGKNIYHLFLSSCWDSRDSIVPVRGTSPGALQVVADLGVQPDLIFIDGEHDYDSVMCDLEAAHRHFPQATLTGDDWTWDKNTQPPRAVREAVEDFAAARGWRIEARENTWALDR